VEADPEALFDIDECTFVPETDADTGRKVFVRTSAGKHGEIYQDLLFDDPTTNQPKVVRRALSADGQEFMYTELTNPSGETRTVRHSRHRTVRGEEYEYEYMYNDEGDETVSERKLVEDAKQETIDPIAQQATRPQVPSQGRGSSVSSAPRLKLRVTLPVALFDSDAKPRAVTTAESKPQLVDLSERELVATTDRENPLAQLIPKLRSEAGRAQTENLAEVLERLQQEIAQRTVVRDDLKRQVDALKNPPPKPKRKLEISAVRTVPISTPPDLTKTFALKDYNRRTAWAQTDTTNSMIEEKLKVLERQRTERKAAESLHDSLQTLEQKIADTKTQIEEAKREGEQKKQRIQQLKTEMGNVQDEIQQEDMLALKEEARAREYAAELDRVDGQIKAKQGQLEKVTNQVGALQMHLKEMQKFRLILEAELNDLQKREKPEVRQLVDDLQSSRAKLSEASGKVAQMIKEVEAKRQQLEQLQNSEELKRYQDLKMERLNLERRLKKWTSLLRDSKETLQGLEAFSVANAARRQTAAEGLKVKERMIMRKEAEVADLEQYAELLETMIREHRQNWA
jgi:hypothetical protein